jgi:hypothetical protein
MPRCPHMYTTGSRREPCSASFYTVIRTNRKLSTILTWNKLIKMHRTYPLLGRIKLNFPALPPNPPRPEPCLEFWPLLTLPCFHPTSHVLSDLRGMGQDARIQVIYLHTSKLPSCGDGRAKVVTCDGSIETRWLKCSHPSSHLPRFLVSLAQSVDYIYSSLVCLLESTDKVSETPVLWARTRHQHQPVYIRPSLP